jgi:meiotically up-regulated gene 157 (Mug157) protein
MTNISESLKTEIFAQVRNVVPPKAAEIFENCFTNTLSSAIEIGDDGTAFMVTGDIPAMWLRDSMWQLLPYLHFLDRDEGLKTLAIAVSRKQLGFILLDPYANAFNANPDSAGHSDDVTDMGPWIWERKYEIDSLCSPLLLAYEIWNRTGSTEHLGDFERALVEILRIWRIEQNHETQSTYRFERPDPLLPTDTLVRNGKGPKSAYTGMTWGAFRPSDDATTFGYNVPSNVFAVLTLNQAAEIVETVFSNTTLASQARALAHEIEQGVEEHGTVDTAKWGRVYAYEVDGLGNSLLMDDGNLPSLLSFPFLGWKGNDDTYLRTRAMILSTDNPYWYSGTAAKGIGSPHTPENYVWPIALATQGITATDPAEKQELLETLFSTDAGTGLIHESFHVDDPNKYTRPWFSWANAMYCEFVLNLAGFSLDLGTEK